MKRGKAQVTIFVVIAIAIVLIAGIVFYIKSSAKKELTKDYFIQNNIEPSINNIQDFVIDCLEENSKVSLEKIGVQGGYYNKPEKFYDLDWAFIPYYYYKGEFLMPSTEKIEQELSQSIDNSLTSCVEDIQFKNFQLAFNTPETNSKILKSKVIVTTTFPISIENNGKTTQFELKRHPITLNSSLYDILEIASYITESHKEDPNYICINCLAEFSKEKNVYVVEFKNEIDTEYIKDNVNSF